MIINVIIVYEIIRDFLFNTPYWQVVVMVYDEVTDFQLRTPRVANGGGEGGGGGGGGGDMISGFTHELRPAQVARKRSYKAFHGHSAKMELGSIFLLLSEITAARK